MHTKSNARKICITHKRVAAYKRVFLSLYKKRCAFLCSHNHKTELDIKVATVHFESKVVYATDDGIFVGPSVSGLRLLLMDVDLRLQQMVWPGKSNLSNSRLSSS